MKKTSRVQFDFVLDRLEPLSPLVRPMFGCHAVYLGEKMVLITRKKETERHDNGVWIATAVEHHASLKKIFPSMRPIRLFGTKPSAWQNIPEDADDFEESVLTACELILKNDPRIGKIPVRKKRPAGGKKNTLRKR
ncbi:MAG TPA: hypothetical protein VF490_22120 [Chryseosolibacter sp.]